VIEASIVEARIRETLTGVTHLEIRDLTGTQDHYDATIVATAFEGLSRVAQHQLVYRALGELMAGPVHALALKTFTPEAWESRNTK
jgi:stress-induced morphogen